jgi:hypothetical protein
MKNYPLVQHNVTQVLAMDMMGDITKVLAMDMVEDTSQEEK